MDKKILRNFTTLSKFTSKNAEILFVRVKASEGKKALTAAPSRLLGDSGALNVNFRKISVRKTIWDLEFSEHFFPKFLACLPLLGFSNI